MADCSYQTQRRAAQPAPSREGAASRFWGPSVVLHEFWAARVVLVLSPWRVLYCRTVPGDYTMNTLPCACAVQGHRFNESKC